MTIGWLTALIDRPASSFVQAARFWSAVAGASLSPASGLRGQFATLVPRDGDAYLRVHRVDTGGGSHLHVHVDHIEMFVSRAVAEGASESPCQDVPVVVRSPAGLACCVVQHQAEDVRPESVKSPAGTRHRVDQLCVDIPPDDFDEECEFWSSVTGWDQQRSATHTEFRFLRRPDWSPLRLLLQRRGHGSRPARAHLDLACDDVDSLVAHHQAVGASVTRVFDHWTSMKDPAGFPYCITARDPTMGLLPD